jgi:CheY-like chemotaxis protein
MENPSNVSFLVVDDDTVAVMAIERAIRKLKYMNEIVVACDGREALEILQDPECGLVQKQYIILLDINMPRMDGLEFLSVIRKDPALRRSVIFMMTTSEAPSDIAAAYDHLVAGYIVKEDPRSSLQKALEMLGTYLQIVLLPVKDDVLLRP